MSRVLVVDYDPAWAETFDRLRLHIAPVLREIATAVEHVGSTAVPGLAAKPIIDMSVIVEMREDVAVAINQLATLGYVHRGNLGIADREAFHRPQHLPEHHLYVCPRDSAALANHLAVRDHLRRHPAVAAEYGTLKKELAKRFPDNIDAYIEGKSAFLLRILSVSGFDRTSLPTVDHANRRPSGERRPADA